MTGEVRTQQGYVLEEAPRVLEEAVKVLEEFLTLIHIRGRQAGWFFKMILSVLVATFQAIAWPSSILVREKTI